MRTRLLPLTALMATALVLAGCVVTPTRAVSAERVAAEAIDRLEDDYGVRPTAMDCCDAEARFDHLAEVECVAEVGNRDREVTVVILEIGSDFVRIRAEFADGEGVEENAGPLPTPAAGMVSLMTMADKAVAPLAEQYGSTPVVICPGNDVPLVVGTEIECTVRVPATGAEGIGTLTITEVVGTNFGLDIVVRDV